ncbi:1-phosphatidylinositol 4,5-bisphosphate phosphodiesterase beta-1-like isoform X4 [Biomphalaria glabrata]|uniref:1-phosphatidylinositol 4,5-bisphosphate phosphodiesterase n=1 Tax=Biomphalaria glabrata TaxID=6526 RepID=A0A9W2ZV45_BIOGL|nr:1-phosphatidylinositol 4,5-bisphosphate phosphodiesterase beta-1-like isoform X4 [Biomphalaria glabrata]
MAGAKPGVHVVQLRPISVVESLTKGNKFIMFTDRLLSVKRHRFRFQSSQIGTPVTLKVDEKGQILYWRDQNKEMDFLDISLIKDTRTGSQVRVPRDHKLRESLQIGQSDIQLEDKIVSVVYGTDMVNLETINFVSTNKEIAQEWVDELLKYSINLLALNSSALTYLDKLFTRFSLVLNNEGKVSMKNIVKTIASNREDRKKVEKALESVGFHAGKGDALNPQKFTFEGFFNFYRHLCGRTEVDKIFDELGAKKKPYLTVEQFCDFLNKQQRDPRLNEILYPNYSLKQADQLIHKYENKAGMAQKGHLSQDGFLKFLMSEDNNLIPPDKLDMSEDMDQPLAHYFINSSHNTYLTGHQFTGKSAVEMYHQVLLSGCRCVELDCWDGKDSDMEPVITHGYTMCTEILFKDVIEAIAQSAFKTSEYPVILSFENHCSPKQQAKMANYCRTIFGDMLLINPLDTHPLKPDVPLPSPNQLKRKIIIKNKKKHFHRDEPFYKRFLEKNSRKNRAQNMSKRVRTKQTNSMAGGEGLAKVRLSEVEEDVELSTPVPEPSEPHSEESVLDPSVSLPVPEPKSPSRIALEKNLSISSEGTTETTELPKEADDAFDSESESSDSDDDDETVPDVEKESNKKKQKKILTEEEKKRRQRMKKEKGTAGKEASAAMEMSLLVNYIQPVHFHSFDASEKRKRSYEITSFVETQGTSLLKEFPVEFVNYNKRQMSRIYPRGTRVDSSNFMPQVFWNAGCQLVALNFQTLDLAMQVNLGIFEYNGRTGYILKPDFMRRRDRHFDPFAESTVDGIIAGTVSVKIISAQFLSDKKISTYVEVDMYGLPTDTIRKKFRTKIVPNNGMNPVYDEEPFVFKKVVLPNLATVRIAVYDEQGKSMIGHRILPVESLRPGYRHIPLRNECNQPLLMPTLFVHIIVKDYVPDGLAEYAEALSNPIAYQSDLVKKHAQQLEILSEEFDEETAEREADLLDTFGDDALKQSISQSSVDPMASIGGASTPDQTGNKRQNSVTSQRNVVNISPLPPSDASMSKRNNSLNHNPVTKQESSQSANSQGSSGSSATAPMTRMSSTIMGQDNGASAAVQVTKLSDTTILNPTPLSELKTLRLFQKAETKREKELEALRRKHERAREMLEEQHQMLLGKLISNQTKTRISMEKNHSKVLKKVAKEGKNVEQKQNQLKGELQELLTIQDLKHREMKASHSRSMLKLCKEHCQLELEVKSRHHEHIYDVLAKLMEANHSGHAKTLDEIHDREVKELKNRMDAKSRDHMKQLGKKHKDKQELSRIKREAQQKHVQTAVTERQKLKDILDKRQSELETKLDGIKKEYLKERDEVLLSYKKEFEDSIQKLEDEFGLCGEEDFNEEDNREDMNNSCAVHSNGELERGPHVATITVTTPSKESRSLGDENSEEAVEDAELIEKVNSEEQLTNM